MGAPSPLHESRVTLLGGLADLAGFVIPSRIDANLTPDLVRIHQRHPRLFVADAKATESSGNRETKARFLLYLKAIQPWLNCGFTVQVAICTDPDPFGSWLKTLRAMAQFSGLVSSAANTYLVDEETQIAWLTVQLTPVEISAPVLRPLDRGATPSRPVQTEV